MKTTLADNRIKGPDLDGKLFGLLKQAPPTGWALSQLKRRHDVSLRQIGDFAMRHSTLVEIASRRNVRGRVEPVLRLKPDAAIPEAVPAGSQPPAVTNAPPEPEPQAEKPTFTPPSQYSLEVDRLRLMDLLEYAPRYSNFLADVGFEMELVKRIAEEYPNTISIEAGQLGQKYVWHVSMIKQPAPEVAAQQVKAPQPPAPLPLSAEEMSRARWRPGGPARRRGQSVGSQEHRPRNPLVDLG